MSETTTTPVDIEHLKYPTGRFHYRPELDETNRAGYIDRIRRLPQELREAVQGLTENQLDTPYRPGGWTVRQVIHHVADSHINAYIRFKLALTEDTPPVKPYLEKRWAELPDTQPTPVAVSLDLLEALHTRWTTLLDHLAPSDWSREVAHPEYDRNVPLARFLALYAWHGAHHLAHVKLVG